MPNTVFSTTAYVTGFFCLNIALAMCIPMTVDLVDGNDDWMAFFASASLIATLSLFAIFATRGRFAPFSLRLGFILVNALWLFTSLACALPFFLSGEGISFTDAVFEAVSGVTTTGSTVLSGLDTMPRGLLLWRSITQWLGGIGILAMGLLLLPFLQIGGMQIYKLESSTQTDNPFAKFGSFAMAMAMLYIVLTLACVLGYLAAGMTLFDAVNHAMTTISTGGYSTHDASMGYFGTQVHIVAIVFMAAGGMPFAAMLRAIVTRDIRRGYDPQMPALLAIFAVLTLGVIMAMLPLIEGNLGTVAVHALFNVVSVVTTTGYASIDYSTWGSAVAGIVLVATFLGGAAGSTAGGFKTYRLIILYQTVHSAVRELLYPHGVFVVRYDGRRVPDSTLRSITIFTATFMAILLAITVVLAATGLDLVTAFSGSLTALTNVGPGLGPIIGPAGNFSSLSDTAKWVLSFAMLVGRLEIMTVLVLLTPVFWQR